MEETYTDQYIFWPRDARAEAYYHSLPEVIQVQIRSMKRRPATYEELVEAVEGARKVQ